MGLVEEELSVHLGVDGIAIEEEHSNEYGNEMDLKKFIKNEFQLQNAHMQSMNEMLRRNMVTTKLISKNLNTYFTNLNLNYRDEFQDLLPVKTQEDLKSLNLRCLEDDFRKKLVSNN